MAETVEIDIVANDKTSSIIQGIFQGIGQQIANFAMQIPGAIMDFGADILNEAMEAQDGMAQLEAVIKSTGGAAGMTADELTKMADELSQVTRFSDDAIIGGENLLLTFTNIGEEVFPDATKAILDISTAMKQDLKSSAVQLGKALNDPIEGVGALTRVGVQFTDEQKKMIETLVESGDVVGAQKIILAELNKEFGGSAEAAGKTFAGSMDILNNKFNDVKETLGVALIPVLTLLMEKVIIPLIPTIEKMAQAFADWISSPEFSEGISKAGDLFLVLLDGIMQIGDWVEANLTPAFEKFGAWWSENSPAIMEWAGKIWTTISEGVSKLWTEFIQPFVEENLPKLQAWWVENSPLIMSAVGKLVDIFATAFPIIIDLVIALEPILSGLLQVIMDVITFTLQLIDGDWKGAWETAKNIVVTIAESIGEAIYNLSGVIVEALGFEKNNPLEVWQSNWNQAVDIVKGVIAIIIQEIENFVTNIVAKISNIGTEFRRVMSIISSPEGVNAAIGSVAGSLGIAGYANGTGGWQTVPPGFPNDSFPVGLTSGENFSVVPSGGGAPTGGNINITLQYSPSVALGNQYEAENALLPFILQGIRAAQANGLVPVG